MDPQRPSHQVANPAALVESVSFREDFDIAQVGQQPQDQAPGHLGGDRLEEDPEVAASPAQLEIARYSLGVELLPGLLKPLEAILSISIGGILAFCKYMLYLIRRRTWTRTR